MKVNMTASDAYVPIRNADAFAMQWKLPDGETLLNGNEQFQNIHERQRHLVGQMVDACILLHILERLKAGAGLSELDYFFPKEQYTQQEEETLRNGSDEERIKALVTMRQEATPATRIRTRLSLVDQMSWERYMREAENYEAASDAINGASNIAWLVRPEDPRLSAINDHIRSTVMIIDPGPKTPKSIELKQEKYGGVEVGGLRDLNRLAILPRHPEYVDDFRKILGELFPPKEIMHDGRVVCIEQGFSERPEVFSSGYYNQKIFAAIDRQRDGTPTKDNTATIAEIKILPASMYMTEKMTGLIKGIISDLKDPSLYVSDGMDNQLKERRAKLKKKYEDTRVAYNELQDAQDKGVARYKFPEFVKDVRNETAYKILRDALTQLRVDLHVDAIAADDRDWRTQYLQAVIYQKQFRDGKKAKRFGRKVERIPEPDLQCDDFLPQGLLNKIARGDGTEDAKRGEINLRELETGIRTKVSQAGWHINANGDSGEPKSAALS